MGCLRLVKRKDRDELESKHFDRNGKRTQIGTMRSLLKIIDAEINNLKAVIVYFTKGGSSNNDKTKRALYLSTMKIIFLWGEKMIEINPEV